MLKGARNSLSTDTLHRSSENSEGLCWLVTYVILHIFSWQLKQPGGCLITMQAEVNMESRLLLLKLADKGPLNKDIYETLSPVEKQLCHRLTRLVTRGKRGRKVPILLLGHTKASLDFLVKNGGKVAFLRRTPFCLQGLVQQPIFVGATASENMLKRARPKTQNCWGQQRYASTLLPYVSFSTLTIRYLSVLLVSRGMTLESTVSITGRQIKHFRRRRSPNCRSPWSMEQSCWKGGVLRHWTLWSVGGNLILTHYKFITLPLIWVCVGIFLHVYFFYTHSTVFCLSYQTICIFLTILFNFIVSLF